MCPDFGPDQPHCQTEIAYSPTTVYTKNYRTRFTIYPYTNQRHNLDSFNIFTSLVRVRSTAICLFV